SADLTDGQIVTTVEGTTFTVNISDSAVSITDGAGNTVNVIVTDVLASNGVIHVIDGVILPS
ncbi:MAG: fasciclin domain-containing protein, partial [Longimicrobiales bacterium]